MSEMLRASIVRVRRDSDQQVVGVGFLVDGGKKTILTCAHVVNAAIGDTKNQFKPRSLITLDFPFIDTEQRFDARVTHFIPKKADNTDDIAVLELLDVLPQGAKAVQLAAVDTYNGHEFSVYGFPQGFEENGQYVEGKLQERLVNKRIQAVGTSNLGHFVEEGFSGSPVYDKELKAVVGMMMSIADEREKRVAYICPPDVMAGLYPDLPYKKIEYSAKVPASTSTPSGKWLQRVDIFISSPSDVAEEREAILRVIERLNRLSYIRSRYVLNPLLYEKEVPPEAGDHAQMVVDRYMAVGDSYLLVCLMWNRMGTSFKHPQTGEEFQSGTEYEFTVGYRANSKNGQPHLLVYRKTTEQTDADKSEKEKVDNFFKRFEGNEATFKGLYKQFSSLSEFENMLFEHIERILHNNPPATNHPDNHVDPQSRPDIVEEYRRLDAAMPRECQVGRPTEVRIMICLPTSDGLRGELPDFTKEGDLIDKRDVRGSELAVAFPINKVTAQLERIRLTIEIKSTDFEIDEPVQEFWLSPQRNSGMLLFRLNPVKVNPRSRVHIILRSKSPDGYVIVLGAASLMTEIKSKGTRLLAGVILKNVLSVPLGGVIGLSAKNVGQIDYLIEPTMPSRKELQLFSEATLAIQQNNLDYAKQLLYEIVKSDPDGLGVRATEQLTRLQSAIKSSTILPFQLHWIEIPSGKVRLGRTRSSDGGYIKQETVFEVIPFSISKYPITNAQFAQFIEAGGYRKPHWWTQEGWQICQQNQWTMPRYWQAARFNQAEQPVVGISWYEAVAFCLWLSEVAGQMIILPTEQQWQYAAQGHDARKYPWGDIWDASRCNVDSEKPTPVKQYEGRGDSAFGVTDMVGNVWEWCLTSYSTGTTDLQITDARVVRGGAWSSYYEIATVDLRHYMQIDMSRNDVGFRVVTTQS